MSKFNQQYWADRELEAIKNRITDDERMKHELSAIYKRASRDIEREIYNFYARYASREGITIQEAQKRASKMDVEAFAERAKQYVKEKDFSDKANEELALYNLKMKVSRLELLSEQLNLVLTGLYDEQTGYLYDKFNEVARIEAKRQAGILGEGTQLSQKDLEAVVNGSFKVGDFSDNIWADKDALRVKLMQQVTRSIVMGEHPTKLARKLVDELGVSQRNAVRILRTEVGQIQIAQQEANYKENGIEYYQIIREPGACKYCRQMGEDSESINGAPKYKVSEMVPGVNAPLFHPNCRCSTIPVVKYPYK